MKVHSLNKGVFLIVRVADVSNGYKSLAYDSVRDDVLSVDQSGYLVLSYLASNPNSSAGEIFRAINSNSLKMDKEDLDSFLDKLVNKNIIYEQIK